MKVWSRLFWCTLFIVFSCIFFTASTFLHLFREKFQPQIVSTWRLPAWESATATTTTVSTVKTSISIQEAVILPDQVLIFLKYPQSTPLFTKDHFSCVYSSPNSSLSSPSEPFLKQPPNQIDGHDHYNQIVRCPLNPRGFIVYLELKSTGDFIKPGLVHRSDLLVYEAVIDHDNTTIVFVKGFNLRPERVYNASKFECMYGWDFTRPKGLLRSKAISVAQEIVRCETPPTILCRPLSENIKVSVRLKGRRTLHSIARPVAQSLRVIEPSPQAEKPHLICVCTMLRNQAGFLKEWVIYHAWIGVQRWFVYDNNSEDDIASVIEFLVDANYNISRHVWPWVKTQEAGFAHCALRARGLCEWVGFIDVDEFLYLPTGFNLQDVIRNQSSSDVAELHVSCHTFGPSGMKDIPIYGVIIGYTCRMIMPERHKSIVNPQKLNSTLINVVHHFHLRDGFRHVNIDREVLVINHYKYQVWEVFKEKFYRRVATYVVDWQNERNAGSKDRTPGLGTQAIKPYDWSSRFCEVNDTRLRDEVLKNFKVPLTNLLPWQDEANVLHQENTRQRKWLRWLVTIPFLILFLYFKYVTKSCDIICNNHNSNYIARHVNTTLR